MKRTTIFWGFAGLLLAAAPVLPAQEAQPHLTIQAHPGVTHLIGSTPDGRFLVTRGEDGVKMWDWSTGKGQSLPELAGQVSDLSPDGKLLALTDDQTVRLWDIPAGQEIAAFRNDEAPVRGAVFSRDGKTVAAGWNKPGPKAGSRLGVVTTWEITTGRRGPTLETGPGRLSGLAFSPDGKLLAGATSDFPLIGDVTLWEMPTGKVYSRVPANGVHCLAFSPDGKTLAAGCMANYHPGRKESHHVRLWDVANTRDIHCLRHENTIHCLAFTGDGKTLATGGIL